MFRFIAAFLVSLFFASSSWGDDNIFNSVTIIKDETLRVGNEALQVLTTPVDTEGYGLIRTLATTGAVGLTYVYDNNIRNKVQLIKSDSLDKATNAGNIIGNPFLHLGVAAVMYGGAIIDDSPKYKQLGEMLGESVILADATTLVLGQAIGRGRPFLTGNKGNFRPFQFKSDYDSMPSDHTASSFAMASVLSATSESIIAKIFSYAVATFVGFSRIYHDQHWASDVVLGAAIGELCGRVVTRYHGEHLETPLTVVPMVTGDSVSLSLLGNW